ncbi:hypothetical protein AAC387_Pa09g0890 [Persea americana]
MVLVVRGGLIVVVAKGEVEVEGTLWRVGGARAIGLEQGELCSAGDRAKSGDLLMEGKVGSSRGIDNVIREISKGGRVGLLSGGRGLVEGERILFARGTSGDDMRSRDRGKMSNRRLSELRRRKDGLSGSGVGVFQQDGLSDSGVGVFQQDWDGVYQLD